jgi:carbonic anhydrase
MVHQQDEILDHLKEGIRRFKKDVYPERREAYQEAVSAPQHPHTLMITCADSRVDPEAITQSGPGEIFVSRNIGNMVPPYGSALGGVSAVIEYAVDVVKVRHAVICGHSDCGAMKGLLHPETLAAIPTVRKWLSNGDAAMRVLETLEHEDGENLLPKLTEQSVLHQMNHLRTHPSVAGAIAQGRFTLSGWVYDIGRGEVRIYNPELERFENIS